MTPVSPQTDWKTVSQAEILSKHSLKDENLQCRALAAYSKLFNPDGMECDFGDGLHVDWKYLSSFGLPFAKTIVKQDEHAMLGR